MFWVGTEPFDVAIFVIDDGELGHSAEGFENIALHNRVDVLDGHQFFDGQVLEDVGPDVIVE